MNDARSCGERKLDLIALLDGELSPAAQAELDAHVLGCADCRADLAELQSTSTLLRKWEAVDPPRDFAPAIPEPRRTAAAVASGPRLTVLPGRRLRDLFLPAGLGAALAAAAVVLLFRLGAVNAGNSEVAEIRALSAEVAALRTELAQAQSALAQARVQNPVGATVAEAPATSPTAPAGTLPTAFSAGDQDALMKQVAAAIAESESRQDTKFLFTTDQLARSLSMQRREDLATIERQLRDARAETFEALVTTHERLDRLAQPALLEQGIAPRSEGNDERNTDEGRSSVPAEDRLEPHSRK